jgi:hypothetical protein
VSIIQYNVNNVRTYFITHVVYNIILCICIMLVYRWCVYIYLYNDAYLLRSCRPEEVYLEIRLFTRTWLVSTTNCIQLESYIIQKRQHHRNAARRRILIHPYPRATIVRSGIVLRLGSRYVYYI